MTNDAIHSTRLQKAILALAGLIAAAIGLAITFAPNAFFASYGLSLDTDPSLMSELRAPGANLAALGAIMIAGALRANWYTPARLLAITVFFAFAFGRAVSWSVDGAPHTGIHAALAIEVMVGGLVLLFTKPMKTSHSH